MGKSRPFPRIILDSDLRSIKLGSDCWLSRLYHLTKDPAGTVKPSCLFRQLVRPTWSGAVCFAPHCTDMSSGLSFSFWKWAVYGQSSPCKGNVSVPVLLPNDHLMWLPFSTSFSFFHSSSLPFFPALAHISRCRSLPGLRLPLAAHLLLIQHHVPPGLQATKGGWNGSSLCIRDCLLQLSAATLLVGGTLPVIPEVTLVCEKVQSVWSSGSPVVKNSMKMNSSVHPMLLNSMRILVSSVQSS